MPNRILKESICTSESLDGLTAFQENFFYRLIVNCDDYGCMDARPKILASRLYPLKDLRTTQIEDALRALTSAELVTLYEVGGKPFLQMNSWDRHQRIRPESRHKYPAMNEENEDCGDPQNSAANRGEARPISVSQSQLLSESQYGTICTERVENASEHEPAVYQVILADKTYHGVTAADIAKYRELYPGVDVDQELRKMIGWCESNPTKRKTKRGVKAFITNWLSRAQDRGPKVSKTDIFDNV